MKNKIARLMLTCLLVPALLVVSCTPEVHEEEEVVEQIEAPESAPISTEEVEKLLGIQSVASGYSIWQVLPSALGLVAQLALLPNGDIAIGSFNQRIQLLSGGNVRTLVAQEGIQPAVAALPDGRICYSRGNQLMLLDPSTDATELLSNITQGDSANALVSDEDGNIYAATMMRNLYRFTPDGNQATIATSLPFEEGYQITDIDVASDGKIYIAGYNRFIMVNPDGTITTVADDLHYEPTFCEIAPDGYVYIKDIPSGVRRLDPKTGTLTSLQIKTNPGISDLLALSDNEFLFPIGADLIYSYDLATDRATPITVNTVRSWAFAVSNDVVFLATPNLPPILKSHIIRLEADGTKRDLAELTFAYIHAADVDKENNLHLYTDEGFYRVEPDGKITSFTPRFPPEGRIEGMTNIAAGPDNSWYCITTDYNDLIRVWRVDESGEVAVLLITFNRTSFGSAYKVWDARIDVGDDGRLGLIVTAIGSPGQGPYYQRVYRADADGTNLIEVANLDSGRTCGMVDIAIGPNNELFVLTTQDDAEIIYRISQDNDVSEFIVMGTGRDPQSIDVDPDGNVWFCTTVGVFRAVH